MIIIPAIDIIDGKCVRLTKGDYAQKKIYNEDPLEVAKQFEEHGLNRLHLVDLDGAKAKEIVNWKVLERIANNTSLTIDFGGGLKSTKDIEIAFSCGASMITGGSVAVKDKTMFLSWIRDYGADKIILGADVKDEMISVSGWMEDTAIGITEFVKEYMDHGITQVISTDISKDGMLQGVSLDLYKKLRTTFPDLFVIASGGVSTIQDIYDLVEADVPAVIVGKAIYEGRIGLNELKNIS